MEIKEWERLLITVPGLKELVQYQIEQKILKDIALRAKYVESMTVKVNYTDIDKAIYNAWQKYKRSK